MNPVAERLTGWKEEEARGHTLSKVFRIINEQTRKKVASPVERILREGIVIGLANHTLLISRSGKEYPIADAGAPIKDAHGNIVGVVLVFRDQTQERNAQRAVEDAKNFAESIIATIREPLLVLDDTLEVVLANRSFYKVFQVTEQETIGKRVYHLGNGQWNIPELRSLLEDILPSNSHFDDFEVHHRFEKIGERTMLLNARRLLRKQNHSQLILLAIEDITERKQKEEQLLQSEERFRHITNLITDYAYTFRVNPDMTLTGEWVSDSFVKTFGYTLAEITARGGWQSMVHPDDLPLMQQHALKVATGADDIIESRFVARNGTVRWIRDYATHVWSEKENRVVRIYGVAEDITDRKQAEEAINAVHQEYEKLINLIDGIVWKADATTIQFLFVSKQAERILGYPIEQWLNQPTFWQDHIHPDDREWAVPYCIKATQEKRPHQLEYRMIAADGNPVWLRDNVVVTVHNGQPEYLYGIMVDITARKQAELELQQSEERFRLLAESSLTGIYLIQNQKFVYINQSLASTFGYTVDEIIGKLGPLDLTHPDDRPRVVENIQRRVSGGIEGIQYEFRGLKKDGTVIYVEVYGKRIQYNGTVGIIGTLVDITARKHAEQALQANNARYRSIVENLNQAYFEADERGRFTYCNPNLLIISGYTEEELQGMVAFHLIAEEHRQQVVESYRQWLEEKRSDVTMEFKVQTKDGKIFWVEQATHFEFDSSGKFVKATNILRDINERKKAEEELLRSREQYLQFFMENLTANYIVTVDGTVRQCNPAYVNIFGFSSIEEALATNIASLYRTSREREKVLSLLLQKGKLEYFELQMMKKDGTPLYLVANIIGKFDEEGKLVEIRGYLFDDTQRRQLEETLRQTQKLESIGTLASGIAHDFNNILGIILGHASLLERVHNDPERLTQSINTIISTTKRGAALVKQLLTFARKTESVFEPLDVNIIIKELTKMLYETFPRNIPIVPLLDPTLPTIIADATQIHQVLLNLCVNARDAMPHGGTLTLISRTVTSDQLINRFPQATAQQYVELTVSDTGIGMDKQTLSRIFEPFFTTKGVGRGTGLGLSVVHGVLGAHNGFIDVESQPGFGSTFRLYFPAAEKSLYVEETPTTSSSELPSGTETILVIEDEEYLRQALENYLSTNGYTVLAAEDGAKALEIYRARMNDIHLVISDIGLPRMSGDELSRQIKGINPNAKIILASGFIDPNVKSELLKAGIKDIIAKPYTMREVLLKTRQVLDVTL